MSLPATAAARVGGGLAAAPARAVAGADVEAEGLTVAYGEQPPVLRSVGFAIGHGETVALIGANGAGKSTLLKACLGLVGPRAGDIRLVGRSMVAAGARERRRILAATGFVAQRHNLVLRLSALSNVIHGCLAERPGPACWLQGTAPAAIRRRALEALDLVGLAGFAARRVDALSGGQQQRVAIARALVARPRLILADEPAASLDPVAGEEVMQLFARVSRETDTTLLFTTHNLGHALGHARRVLGLRHGALVIDAPAASLAEAELHDFYG